MNFSSSRIGLLQERDAWRILQSWLADHLCEPVYQEWIQVAWRTGKLAPRMTPEQNAMHVWRSRGWAYTNPQQEQTADMLAVAAGFTSPQRVVADNGEELEDIYAEIAAANVLAEQYDIQRFVLNQVINPEAQNATPDEAPAGEVQTRTLTIDREALRCEPWGRPDAGLALLRSAGRTVLR